MTEADWLACTEPERMLKFIQGRASDRRLRLFACACLRQVWLDLTDERIRESVEAVERGADRREEPADFRATAVEIRSPTPGRYYESPNPEAPPYVAVGSSVTPDAVLCLIEAIKLFNEIMPEVYGVVVEAPRKDGEVVEYGTPLFRIMPTAVREESDGERHRRAELVRCVFGNPFRAVAFDPAWRTPGVFALAAVIHDDRRFHDFPVLADALEEAGCVDARLLAHLRGPGPHAPGCWAMDLVLKKE